MIIIKWTIWVLTITVSKLPTNIHCLNASPSYFGSASALRWNSPFLPAIASPQPSFSSSELTIAPLRLLISSQILRIAPLPSSLLLPSYFILFLFSNFNFDITSSYLLLLASAAINEERRKKRRRRKKKKWRMNEMEGWKGLFIGKGSVDGK